MLTYREPQRGPQPSRLCSTAPARSQGLSQAPWSPPASDRQASKQRAGESSPMRECPFHTGHPTHTGTMGIPDPRVPWASSSCFRDAPTLTLCRLQAKCWPVWPMPSISDRQQQASDRSLHASVSAHSSQKICYKSTRPIGHTFSHDSSVRRPNWHIRRCSTRPPERKLRPAQVIGGERQCFQNSFPSVRLY